MPTTRNLDPIFEGPREEQNFVRKENECLMDGMTPTVNALDDTTY